MSEDGRLLLAPLVDTPTPSSTLDAAALVAAGRRRVRRRRLGAIGGAGAVSLAALVTVPVLWAGPTDRPAPVAPVPSGPAVPASCTAARLPVPAGTTESVVLGGEPSGRYLVGRAEGGGDREWALLWDRGRLTVLDPPGEFGDWLVVNAAGVVAGRSHVDGRPFSWVYEHGAYRTLDGPGGRYVGVTAINSRGDLLGGGPTAVAAAVAAVPRTGPFARPVVWPAADRRPRELPAPGADAVAYDIDDDGTVVGVLKYRGSAGRLGMRAVAWDPAGNIRELPVPPGAVPSGATAVRAGQILGWYAPANDPNGERTPVLRWTGTGGPEPIDGIDRGYAINAHGWVVGGRRTPEGFAAAVVAGDRVVPLPFAPGTSAPKWELSRGEFTISDDGRSLGGVLPSEVTVFAVRWTCR
jgi:uncharacterized membrane protein